MNQERIMKRRMFTAIILWIVTLISLLVFIGLYIDETHKLQASYKKQYITELGHAKEELEHYLNSEGNFEERYRRITSYVSSANSFAFLIDDLNDKQKTINEINTCLIKYPEQMKGKMEELDKAFEDILADLDKGYEEADAIVASIDKLGH